MAAALSSTIANVQDLLRDALSTALFDVVLPGVEMRVYQGANGTWYANILLDKRLYPEPPVKIGNRPRVESSSGRWWYDPSAGLTNFDVPADSPERQRTSEQAREALNAEVVDILTQTAAVNLRSALAETVRAR